MKTKVFYVNTHVRIIAVVLTLIKEGVWFSIDPYQKNTWCVAIKEETFSYILELVKQLYGNDIHLIN